MHKNGKGIWGSRGGGALASFVTEGDRCGWDIGGENNHYHCNLIILHNESDSRLCALKPALSITTQPRKLGALTPRLSFSPRLLEL